MKNYVVDKTREVIRDFQRYNSYEKAYLFGQVLWLVAVAILITLTPVLVKILTDDTALTGIVRAVYQWTIAIGSLGAGDVFKAVSTRRVLITTSLMRGAIFGLVAILLFAQQLTFSLLVIITGINALIITISHLADFDMAGSNKVFSSAAKKEKARYLFTLLDYFVLLLLRPQGDEKREPAKMAQMIGFLAWKGESVSLRCSMKTSLGTTKGVCLQRAAQESLTTPRNNNNPQITSALFPRRSARLARGAGALLLAACFSATVPLFARDFYPQQDEYIPKLMKFLSEGSANKGALYQGTCGKLKDKWLPLSYVATPDYWTKYVANIPNNNLSVTDRYDSSNYTLTPVKTTPGADLQVERVMINYGTNIYDSACWQIALGVYGRSKDSGADSNKYFNLASNQTLLLTEGYDGNADSPAANANRAITKGDTFKYNGATITDPKNAFFFRMITRNWLSEDPFIRTAYLDRYVTAENLPRDNAAYARGKITWVDWKPITGENAWALLLGPIQLDRLKTASLHQSHVPFASTSVQNAIHALKAFSSMQAPIGCFYYACQGTSANQGDDKVDKYEVSVENNASALGGLLILKTTLEEEKKHEPSQSAAIQAALNQVNVMINGGKTVQNYDTEGLVQFFKKYAWDKTSKSFVQGGFANDPKRSQPWVVNVSAAKAVDAGTWSAAVLGQPLIDSWFGFGTAHELWKNIKGWGGYFGPNKTLLGVGFSDKDGNGPGADYRQGINSAEWTAGAINFLRCMISDYENVKSTDPNHAKAKSYAHEMINDQSTMLKGMMELRTDTYPTEQVYASVRPANYRELLSMPPDKVAFIYASKRYMIPFGWFANPLPSTTASSWAIMLHYNFNPFNPTGTYEAFLKP